MRARIGLDNPGFEGRLRYQHRGSSYIRRSVVDGVPRAQVFDIVPTAPKPKPHTPMPRRQRHLPASLSPDVAKIDKPTLSVFAAQLHSDGKATQPKQPLAKKRVKWPGRQVLVVYSMAGLLFVGGSVVAINGLFANRHVEAQVQTLVKASKQPTSGADSGAPLGGGPSVTALRNYTVAPNMPRYIDIPKLKQHARVVSIGTKADGSLAAPGNVYDIGWYNGSNLPGQRGAMLLDGHRSNWTEHGTFYEIKSLVAGDIIKIERGDGKVLTYKVVKSKLYDHKRVDMKSAMVSVDPKKPGLNMITCAGKVIPGTNEFDKRLIVYAVMQ